jgi:hypothetical protein
MVMDGKIARNARINGDGVVVHEGELVAETFQRRCKE